MIAIWNENSCRLIFDSVRLYTLVVDMNVTFNLRHFFVEAIYCSTSSTITY